MNSKRRKSDANAMDHPTKPDRVVRRRQDPVSCRLCRVKKLKCNRNNPCSNCLARNTACEFDASQISTRVNQEAEISNATILARVQRLEDMIQRLSQNLPATPESASSRKQESELMGLSPATMAAGGAHDLESEDLTNLNTDSVSLFPTLSSGFVFDMVALDYIAKHEVSSIDQSYLSSCPQKRILLPTYNEARTMFDRYAKYICHFHRIVHIPSLRRILENVYGRLSRGEQIEIPHALLLISVFATVLMYATWTEKESVALKISVERDAVFMIWFRHSLDLLDHCRRVLSGSVEVVQSAIIMMLLDYNLEGFTPRARSILAQGLQTAKDLAMHRIDCPSLIKRREGRATIDSMVETEMKRRMWWHLTATDWMLSLAGGSQEGTYTAHPQQMRVRLPRNIDDEVLDQGNTTEDLPLTSPTPMCYPLQRIRLAEIMRSVVDTLRFGLSDPTEYDYLQILAIDKRIEHFLEDLPVFLKLDEDSIRRSQYTLQQYPYFGMQRYIINVGAQTVRCKLHQPFLARGTGHQYPKSVEKCLNSAMEVININKAIRRESIAYLPEQVKKVGMLHHMFLATVVLVMDLCFNRINDTSDPRAVDVMTAIKMLEEVKDHSAAAQKFLDTLMDALKKHQVRLVEAPGQANDQSLNSHQDIAAIRRSGVMLLPPQHGTLPLAVPQEAGSQTATVGFEDVWREAIHQGEVTTMPDWDTLFSELDAFIA